MSLTSQNLARSWTCELPRLWAEQSVGLCCKEANKNTFLKHRMVRATEIQPPQMQYLSLYFFKSPNAKGHKWLEDVRWFLGLARSVSGPCQWVV